MRARLEAMTGGMCAAVLLIGGLAACSTGPDGGGLAGPDNTGRPSLQEPSPPGTATPRTRPAETGEVSPHPYVGMWVTADGHIRQELLANGRYDEARGERESAYTGSYRVLGTRIEYVDDTGFSADGTFDEDVLHHGGYVFHREGSDAHRRAREEER
ncbi:Atu4866 domain-containing protein [Streptosporangium sp. NPDC000563]|uniref:Atu4866 domain-containing protein n=1 Tax=Streptosporangium sp. NPDC000563 TaxID=3154366 RepID=UPI003317B7A4